MICTLKDLLKNDEKNMAMIKIPRIQRDYAQGRKGGHYIRKAMLNDINNALGNDRDEILDFVYGNIITIDSKEKFYPLDGQQRLTTLWLIYWYISFYSGNLKDDYIWLQNFSYETRVSSREFCEKMCSELKDKDYDKDVKNNGFRSLKEYIVSQNWFYSEWKNNSTIDAMLRTLSGEWKDDKCVDRACIEMIFDGTYIVDNDNSGEKKGTVTWDAYYDRLFGNDKVGSKIKFHFYEIEDDDIDADDLYVKMNARGKRLSNLENLKGDLLNDVEKKKLTCQFLEKGISDLFDKDWLDIFWDYERDYEEENLKNGKLLYDDRFFMFLNRVFLNQICLKDENDKTSEFKKAAKNYNDYDENSLFYHFGKLYNEAEDALIEYNDYAIYEDYFNQTFVNQLCYIFEGIKKSLDKIQNNNTKKKDFYIYFMPEKDDKIDKLLKNTTQIERSKFLGFCYYMCDIGKCKVEYDDVVLKDWINLIDRISSSVDTVPEMVDSLRIVNKIANIISQNLWDINKGLVNFSLDKYSNICEKQCEEEKYKAIMIENAPDRDDWNKYLDDNEISENNPKNNWSSLIRKCENYSIFNGTIRFLMKNKNDEYIIETKATESEVKGADGSVKNIKKYVVDDSIVKSFLNKWENAQKLFNDINNGSPIPLELYKDWLYPWLENDVCNKSLEVGVGGLLLCGKDLKKHGYHFVNEILCNNDFAEIVDSILLGNEHITYDKTYKMFIELISDIYNNVKEEEVKFKLSKIDNYIVFNKTISGTNQHRIYISECRKEWCKIFHNLVAGKIIEINDSNFCCSTSNNDWFYWGNDIEFSYKNDTYYWSLDVKTGENKIKKKENKKRVDVYTWYDTQNYESVLSDIKGKLDIS